MVDSRECVLSAVSKVLRRGFTLLKAGRLQVMTWTVGTGCGEAEVLLLDANCAYGYLRFEVRVGVMVYEVRAVLYEGCVVKARVSEVRTVHAELGECVKEALGKLLEAGLDVSSDEDKWIVQGVPGKCGECFEVVSAPRIDMDLKWSWYLNVGFTVRDKCAGGSYDVEARAYVYRVEVVSGDFVLDVESESSVEEYERELMRDLIDMYG